MSNGADKNDFKILFGKNLKRIRESKNLIFRQLAIHCNVDYSDTSKIKKGKGIFNYLLYWNYPKA